MTSNNSVVLHSQRAGAAIKTAFVADSLAMPVHWYYRRADIENNFPGGVRDLQAAPDSHPSSVMSLHSTRQGGRANNYSAEPGRDVVGDLILKGRRRFWNVNNMHYHQGMVAGDNTLNAHCARVLMRTINSNQGQYNKLLFLDDYIGFMTADPPAHADTYAESSHRGFFANLQRGLPPQRCAAVTHDTASIGGLVSIGPLAIALLRNGHTLSSAQNHCRVHMFLSHPDPHMASISDSYVKLIDRLLTREDDQNVITLLEETAAESAGFRLQNLLDKKLDDYEVVGLRYSTACYIEGAWPSVLYLAAKYASDTRAGLIANTNAGGDNVHRGFVLGILYGLISGQTQDDWFQRLIASEALEQEISILVSAGHQN
ncbi:MAG: ADP-ribosylglycohydrolase family protein [Pseudohongiella sp.]|nr:ADP-ribosylglycohydrolase family protein [Pseudohongiella sp.]MDO9519462.1 ADP-ribosylglycohydrolase family protein [Pseudohongiella sp.]MDP2127530.1 ADP-ribosylglycohydrolase family protein [Pseudohongiella sp.]